MCNKIKEARRQRKETKKFKEWKTRSQTSNIDEIPAKKTIAFPRLRDRGTEQPTRQPRPWTTS
jgi:hypothetical protein